MNKQHLILAVGLWLMLWGVLPAPVQATASKLQEKRTLPPEGSGPIIGQLPGSGRALAVQGDYAYVGFGGDFVVIDISDKSAPEEISRLPIEQTIFAIAVKGNYAYLGTMDGVQIVDVSQPNNPQWHSLIEDLLVTKVLIEGSYLYTLSSNGFKIMDLQNAPTLQTVGQFAREFGTPLDIDIVNDYVFLLAGAYEDILIVLDITDKTNPTEAFSRPEFFNRIAVTHNRYVRIDGTCSQICETTFNVSSWRASDWQFEGVYIYRTYNSSYTYAEMTDGLYGYVGKEIGLFVYDLYKEQAFVEWFDLKGNIRDIQLAGDHIYVISDEHQDWPNPNVEGSFYILPAPSPAHRVYLPFVPHQ